VLYSILFVRPRGRRKTKAILPLTSLLSIHMVGTAPYKHEDYQEALPAEPPAEYRINTIGSSPSK
jgi:hypothetical protein